jgi:hypothetical protein
MTLIPYLFIRFFYRLKEFLRHWYFDSFRLYSNFVISLLEKLDRRLAFKVTLQHLFQPLYQDQTTIGFILGFFFRSARLIVGGFIYLIMAFIAVLVYLAWLAVPLYLIFQIIANCQSFVNLF